MENDAQQAAWGDWRKQRHDELAGPESWLGLTGLFWLEHGVNAVGSADDAIVRLPGGPQRLGILRLEADGQVFWQPASGPGMILANDRQGTPTVVEARNFSFFLLDRDGRVAVRVRDREWGKHRVFSGLDYFPFDPAWQVEAAWLKFPEPRLMEVPNVSGDLKKVEVSHHAVFEVDGQTVSLLPVSVDDTGVFFVFRDHSSGRETYGAGRFLKAETVIDGRIRLDFNRAFNPPCAFTPFATCPLPPPENWLPFVVAAGEKKPAQSAH